MTASNKTSAALTQRIVDILSDRQAENVVLLDIQRVASFTDFFVIATAQNSRHMRALMETLDRDLAAEACTRATSRARRTRAGCFWTSAT